MRYHLIPLRPSHGGEIVLSIDIHIKTIEQKNPNFIEIIGFTGAV
jgi:hypothetical protein